MLILGRRQGDQIRIGDEIIIKILGISRQSVRIGIEAPKEIPVFREEVYLRRLAESDQPIED